MIGGNTMLEGILQICIDGVWGVICDSEYAIDFDEMSVACAGMGFSSIGMSTIKI